jgi:hypothetical protein
MNDRIKELFEQVKAESNQWLGSKPGIAITYDELGKLAELIVKECIDRAERYGLGSDAVEQMKEDFGVE